MNENRWAAKWVARVAGNALAGGALVAFVGALCLGAGGWLTGAILDYSGIIGDPGYARQGAHLGVELGMLTGVVGFLIFGIAALKAAPGNFSQPILALGGRVALGQFIATLGTTVSFFAFEYAKAHLHGQRLASEVFGDVLWLLLGAPLLMICGAIAGALSKRQHSQSATLKAE